MRPEQGPPAHWVERSIKALRHPLRVLLTLLVVVLVVSSFSSGWGLAAAVLGTLAGLFLGELLGRSRLRLEGIAAGVLGGLLLAWLLASLVTRMELVAWLLSPSAALHLSAVVWFGLASLLVVGGLRSVASRRPGWVVAELALLAGGFASAFSAHRQGAIARPLWLSDPVWKAGYDPAVVLLAVGAVFATGLGVLLLLESKQRLSLGAALLLPLLGLGIWSLVDVRDLQQPPEVAELAEIKESIGDPPTSTSSQPGQEDGTGTGEQSEPATARGESPEGSGSGEPGEGSGGGAGGNTAKPHERGGGSEGDGGEQAGSSSEKPDRKPPSGQQPDQGQGGGSESADAAQGGEDGDTERPEGQRGERPAPGEAGGDEPDGEGDGAAPSGTQEDGSTSAEDGGKSDRNEGQGSEEGSESDEPTDAQGEGGGQGDGQTDAQPKPEDGEGAESEEPTAPTPVAVVLLGDDYQPPSGGYYLRQEAHSEFNGTRLVPSSQVGLDQDSLDHFPTRLERVAHPPPRKGRKQIVGSVSLLVPHDTPFAPEAPELYEPRVNPNPARFVASYGFESWAQEVDYEDLIGSTAGSPTWSEEEWALYTDIPADQRYRDLAEQLTSALPDEVREDPFAQALAIKLYLDANTKYTKSKRHQGAADPTADYLFGDFEGYCVHTAHASVFLWRALGLPARVGTGYLVTEEARRGSALVVMGRDAHAWPEVYLQDYGWIVLDVAPEQILDSPGLPADEDMIDLLSEMAREEPAEQVAVHRDRSPVKRFLQRAVLALLIGVIIGTLGVHWLIKLWRGVRPELCAPTQLSRVGYRRALDLLSEAGLSREFGETREAHARRLAHIVPTLTPLTDWHLAAGLGGPIGSGEAEVTNRAAWRAALRNLRFELTRAAPWWRRALGALNPFSFYWSR